MNTFLKTLLLLIMLLCFNYSYCDEKPLIEKAVKDSQLKMCILNAVDLVGGLNNVIKLVCKERKIESLEGITILQNLTELDVSTNRITKLSELIDLKKLEKLDISRNFRRETLPNRTEKYKTVEYKVIDLAGIDKIEHLKELTASMCYLKKFPRLESKSLTKLVLAYNYIENIEPLSSMKSLAILDLSYNRVKDISPLSEIIGIKKLNLMGNRIKEISSIVKMQFLEDLYLSGNYISDISVIDKLPKIKQVEVENNCLKQKIYIIDKKEFKINEARKIIECENPVYHDMGWGVEGLN